MRHFFPGSDKWQEAAEKLDLKALEEASPNMKLFLMSGDIAVGYDDDEEYVNTVSSQFPWATVILGRTRGAVPHYIQLAELDPDEVDAVLAM